MKNDNNTLDINLWHMFVAMLFAFAIAQVGESIIVILLSINKSSFQSIHVSSIFQSILSVFVISMSWIGWSRSLEKSEILISPYEKNYVLFLLDIILVLIYYILAFSVDSNENINVISAIEETYAMLAIFIVYGIWIIIRDETFAAAKNAFSCIILILILAFIMDCFDVWHNFFAVIVADILLISVTFGFRSLRMKHANTLAYNIWLYKLFFRFNSLIKKY